MLNLAYNLVHGRNQLFALKYPFVPHPPFYFMTGGLFVVLFGHNILSLRILCALLGVGTAVALYLIGRDFFDEETGFIAGLLYAVYPAAVFFNRMAFANNQVVFLSVLSLYALLKYSHLRRRRWLVASSLLAGLSFVSGFIGVASMLAVIAFIFREDRKMLPLAFLSLSFFPAIYVASMLYLMPDSFITDLTHHGGRTAMGFTQEYLLFSFLVVITSFVLAYTMKFLFTPVSKSENGFPIVYAFFGLLVFFWLYTRFDIIVSHGLDYLTVFSSIGLLVCPLYLMRDGTAKRVFLLYLASYALTLLFFNRTDHMTMVLYPYVALGLATLMSGVFTLSRNHIGRTVRTSTALIGSLILAFHPIALCLVQDIIMLSDADVLKADAARALRVAAYVNERTRPGDVVFTYSWMAPMISAEAATLDQALTYDGYGILFFYPGNYPNERWVFNTSLSNAKYIVVLDESLTEVEKGDRQSFMFLDNELRRREKTVVDGFGVYGPRL